jgi:tRNA 2-thiouridine synthesizing protein A
MRVIKTLEGGDEVEVVADDRAFPADVEAWCKKTGNSLISLTQDDAGHVARVRKT